MGVPVRVVLYTDSKEFAEKCANIAFEQFEKLNEIMSDYDKESEIVQLAIKNDAKFNSQAGKEPTCSPDEDGWVEISEDLALVLSSARHFSEISDGAFEVSISPLVQIWRRAKRQHKLPTDEEIAAAKSVVGLENWELDVPGKKILLKKKGIRFDLGAIAKGYAIDKAFEAVQKEGVNVLLIDAGGDIRVGDAPPESSPKGWKIGVVTLKDRSEPLETLYLSNTAIATSGDTFQYWELDGKRYSHIIDPRTGRPVENRSISTVIANTATEADALASVLNIFPPDKGVELTNCLPEISSFVVIREDKESYDNLRFFRSKKWKISSALQK
ncbi:MAG: FAD:protein FMN transferase [Thermoguttaceae bacterium]